MSRVVLRRLFVFALFSCALFACAKTRNVENSSETHFLARCEDDSCAAGLECLCGVCTEACTAESRCTALSSRASCIAPAEASCAQERVCDVECQRDSDCSALGDRTCEAGRCRERRTSVADGGASDADQGPRAPPSCDTAGLSALFDASTPVFCPPGGFDAGVDGGAMAEALEETRACVETAMAEGRSFLVYSTQVGTDSLHGGGYLGVRDGDAWKAYDLSYDSIGIDMGGVGVGFEPLWWNPCLSFSVNASCQEGCFECETMRTNACGCAPGQDGAPPSVRCLEPDLPPCEELSCELEGVCYSPRDLFADTFHTCLCDEDGRHCEANGEASNAIGRRCAIDRDCAPGHMCAADFCTRPCGPGCPRDSECVDDLCFRTCDPSDGDLQCSELGSECTTLEGSSKTYCL